MGINSGTPIQSLLEEQTLGAAMRVCQAKRIAHPGRVLWVLQQCRCCKKSSTPKGGHWRQKYRAQNRDSGCRGLGSSHHLMNMTPQVARVGESFQATVLLPEAGTSHRTRYPRKDHNCQKFPWGGGSFQPLPAAPSTTLDRRERYELQHHPKWHAVSQAAISSAGTPSGPQHSTRHLRVSSDNPWPWIALVSLALGREMHTSTTFWRFGSNPCAPVVVCPGNSCDRALVAKLLITDFA